MKKAIKSSQVEAERVAFLIAGFLRNNLTMDEREELDHWLLLDQENIELFSNLVADESLQADFEVFESFDTAKALTTLRQKIKDEHKVKRRKVLYKMLPYAAAMVLTIAIGYSFWLASGRSIFPPPEDEVAAISDYLPARNRAVLTIGGRSVVLDSMQGMIANQDGLTIMNTTGNIVYNGTDTSAQMHTLSIPRAGKYHVVLGDGTKVWLNAASTLSYPSSFASTERKVTVQGEAYFEVAPDKKKPFRVAIDGGDIEVMGTHFNVNAYGDEATSRITLLEGRVGFASGANAKHEILKPGQQLQLTAGASTIRTMEQPRRAIAWMENRFDFNDEPLPCIMRQIARWYNVAIDYRVRTDIRLTATIPRDIPVSRLLEKLEKTGLVKFEMTNQTIIVKP